MKLAAILPWFTFLFTLIAAIVMYIASTETAEVTFNRPVEHETEKEQATDAQDLSP